MCLWCPSATCVCGVPVLHVFVVSQCLQSSTGTAVEVIHYFRDCLWAMGPRTSPNACFAAKYVSGAIQPTDDAFEPEDASRYDCRYTAMEAALAATGKEGRGGGRQQADDGWGYEDEDDDDEEGDGGGQETEKVECEGCWEGASDDDNDDGKREEETEVAVQEEVQEGAETAASVDADILNAQGEDGRAVRPKLDLTPEQLDEVLEVCLLEALHVTVTDEQLPLDASALYSKMVAASEYIITASALVKRKLEAAGMTMEELRLACSADLALDVKKSTHKKLSKFLQVFTKKKLFQTKETRGVVFVVKVNRDHPTYKAYTPIPSKDRKIAPGPAAAGGTTSTAADVPGGGGTTGELQIMEFYQPSQKCLPIFEAVGVKTGRDHVFTMTQCNEVLSTYIEKALPANLPAGIKIEERSDTVPIDFHLRAAVVNKTEGSIPLMPKKDLFGRFQSAMNVCHKVYRAGVSDVAPLRKGPVPCVKITIEDRSGGKKHVTHIVGLKTFHVDQAAVAVALQKQLACSASTYELPGKAKELAIMVQGRSGTPSAEFLMSQCLIPKKYIQIESKEKNRPK
eukprot:GHVS01076069.1.p1 GENE.GHVS01076069.1~~GHVS01076069.1.p1  ORF type:complete len:569 (+),score=108.04 GHVS01076069.1:1-1707(+)